MDNCLLFAVGAFTQVIRIVNKGMFYFFNPHENGFGISVLVSRPLFFGINTWQTLLKPWKSSKDA